MFVCLLPTNIACIVREHAYMQKHECAFAAIRYRSKMPDCERLIFCFNKAPLNSVTASMPFCSSLMRSNYPLHPFEFVL